MIEVVQRRKQRLGVMMTTEGFEAVKQVSHTARSRAASVDER